MDKLLKCPGFFAVCIPELNEKELKIPPGFVQDIKKALPKNVALRDSYGNSWQVNVKKVGDTWYFKHGWKKFCVECSLGWGDFVIFKYLGGGIFYVKIFGENACEKKGTTNIHEKKRTTNICEKKQASNACETSGAKGPKDRNAEERYKVAIEEDGDEDIMVLDQESEEDNDQGAQVMDENEGDNNQAEQVVEENGGGNNQGEQVVEENGGGNNPGEQVVEAGAATTRRQRRRRITDWFDRALFASGRAPQPTYPYFVTRCNLSRKDEFHIPGHFISMYNPRLPEKIVLVDPRGREFEVKQKIWTDGRMYYIGGWKDFCIVHLLGPDDKCICQFVDGENGEVYVHISIVRANE